MQIAVDAMLTDYWAEC